MIQTKLNVFSNQFDVNAPQLLKDSIANARGGMYYINWILFQNLIKQVAERAMELNDPILHVLMIQMYLYDIPPEMHRKLIEVLRKEMDEME